MKRKRLVIAMGVPLVIVLGLSGCGKVQGVAITPPGNSAVSDSGGWIQYYVAPTGSDSNDGSATAPWRTISHAAEMVAAGDTVHVLPGVYNESVYLYQG